MQITISRGEIIYEAENVRVKQDIYERTYFKNKDGVTDYRDFKDDVPNDLMDMYSIILDNIAYCRKADYDSSGLIKVLFSKLPNDVASELLKSIQQDYEL